MGMGQVKMHCRFCQKAFSKGEHLRRHERSHTGARPYVCKECKRAFARQDSLTRHERLHTRKDYAVVTPSTSSLHPSSPTPRATPIEEETLSHVAHSDDMLDQVWGESSATSTPMQCTPSSTVNDFGLIWPDSEDLFQTIMSSDPINQWHMPLGTLPCIAGLDHTNIMPFSASANPVYNQGSGIDGTPSGEGHRAVCDVSKMVTTLSSDVTAAVEATSINSVFLDECLHMFFERFIPTFPILHRSTFVFRECTHPLLLNAIAIGSLYLGPKSSIAKGEALWRLAHIALATSWETLITHRGPYDSCSGVQLVVTALLGQIYGALSKNRVIRTTSQAFHALGFFWAKQCGMYDAVSYSADEYPSVDTLDVEKDHQWRIWVAREIQHRALLGNYILDGLNSRMSGELGSIRHTANPLCMPSCELLFEARTSQEWFLQLRSQDLVQSSFRNLFRFLFIPNTGRFGDSIYSAYSLRVVLEGLQSLVSDCDNEDYAIVGVPTKVELRRALIEVHESIERSTHFSTPHKLELLLRWHAVCLDACIGPALLCRSVCAIYKITQHVWGGASGCRTELDLALWVTTEEARRALLHAIAIQEIVEALPRGRAHVIHIPSSLFAAATVYSVFSLAGLPSVNIPTNVDWRDALSADNDPCMILAELSSPSTLSDTKRYILGQPSSTFGVIGEPRNLFYELNSMQKLFRCLSSQWGIAYDMESVLDQWITLCH